MFGAQAEVRRNITRFKPDTNTPQPSTHKKIGGGNASRTPAPILKIKKCVYRYSFGITVDDAICFKTSYSFGVTMDDVIYFKTSYSFGVTVASP